jgi:hypothetical protein
MSWTNKILFGWFPHNNRNKDYRARSSPFVNNKKTAIQKEFPGDFVGGYHDDFMSPRVIIVMSRHR